MSLFTPPDMQTMYPQGAPAFQGNAMPQAQAPQQGADMPVLNGPPPQNFEAPSGDAGIPSYVGNPMIDKYIHMFIGQQV